MGETGICCICGKPYDLYGNNPSPLTEDKDKRCCSVCDNKYVITARAMEKVGRKLTLEDAQMIERGAILANRIEEFKAELKK